MKKSTEPKPKNPMKSKQAGGNGANLGFEVQLWAAADKLRGNMEPSDYKHVALGLIFLKYISDAFEAKRAELLKEELADAEDPEEYLAENVFWVPKEARWSHLQAKAKQPTIGKDIDDAMLAIEARNASLKGVLPKDYARPALNKVMLGELIDLVSGIGMAEEADRSRDILGRVYEYFLGGFAGAEGKRGGEFCTPRSVVRLLVEMLEPYKGRVYDPCCGSGGMFVQSEKFVEEHGGRIGDIAIYGQESNYTTWRLAKMNLAVRGIDADIRWNNEGSFHKDELQDLKADFILANPPPSISPTGAVSGCARTHAGSLACRLWATPTMAGSSTYTTTSRRTARRVWCSPTAPCPPASPARATSAAPWSRVTWWTA
jgi:type I restriction enzyme M protein